HTETRRDPHGQVLTAVEAEVQYVVGSGRRGQTYLIDRDGYLFQSPITWYPQERRWDLSPGYRKENAHSTRVVTEQCLFCHANRVEQVKTSVNRFEPPLFRGQSIGCERCHGPGALHVRRPEVVDGRDLTIVNPRHLEPALRESVCEQC